MRSESYLIYIFVILLLRLVMIQMQITKMIQTQITPSHTHCWYIQIISISYNNPWF